ncbi:Gfo/Idh/MocA family oxidoreductase [Streptomyces sp. VRA16 Mangrove soil]|nr:Gfo/Idh/MocA family oxidoreductase [Streptomyces sp. VRA16 Mangrove soil]
MGVALVGAGVISAQYLRTLSGFADVRVVAVADIDVARAEAAARAHDVPLAGDTATVLAAPEVELVVNLTVPSAHVEVGLAALRAGKHLYGEKPLALRPDEAEKLLAEAAQRGLLVGCAPDTFMGAGLQSALRAVAAGHIGVPVAASTAVRSLGPERWHPSPAFFYQPGAGPLFDLGPYHLTSLVALFGSVGQVAASARQARAERVDGAGRPIPVEVPTHVSALLDFTSGPAATSVLSWDSARPHLHFEVTGTEGTLAVPDPNTFAGPLRVRRNGADDWAELPVRGRTDGRGLGVVDLARAIRSGGAPRASGALALHVLQIMTAVTDSASRGAFVRPPALAVQPEPLPVDWDPAPRTL